MEPKQASEARRKGTEARRKEWEPAQMTGTSPEPAMEVRPATEWEPMQATEAGRKEWELAQMTRASPEPATEMEP